MRHFSVAPERALKDFAVLVSDIKHSPWESTFHAQVPSIRATMRARACLSRHLYAITPYAPLRECARACDRDGDRTVNRRPAISGKASRLIHVAGSHVRRSLQEEVTRARGGGGINFKQSARTESPRSTRRAARFSGNGGNSNPIPI
jgi:hypothetical protein